MEVVACLYETDLLLEDTNKVIVISGSHYMLNLGDQVYIQEMIDEKAKLYEVKISFACADHTMLHEDEVQIKFEGSRAAFDRYLYTRAIH